MNQDAHNKLVSFIWSIADDCLRDVYVRGKYRDVILADGGAQTARCAAGTDQRGGTR